MEMDCLLTVLVALVVTTGIIHLLSRCRTKKGKLPPGSLGVPVIGHTLALLRAMRANTVESFIQDRIHRYGPVSKLSLFGSPTLLLAGPAGNKFLFFNRWLTVRQPPSARRILGEKNILALHGKDHRRIRGALLSEFLAPDMLRTYVGRIDAQVRQHLEENWAGRTTVTVMPLMKRLTFDIMTALVIGDGNDETLDHDLEHVLEGVMTIPVNLPFTPYRRALKASRRARWLLHGIMREKKAKLELELEQGDDDLVSRLLSKIDDQGQQLLTNEEIVDNSMALLVAGRDATAILITFMIRQLADDPDTLAAMVQEHEEIARNKADGEDALTWEDLLQMKFTWRVVQETLRIVPPFFGSMRTALEDMEFQGYPIPKGWQVFWAPSVTHMDPSIFHDPAKFDPSRFENHSATAPRCSFVAFGGGPRICAGIDFAKMETLLIMHYLVRRFRWKLCSEDNTVVMDPLASPLNGLPIHLHHYGTTA